MQLAAEHSAACTRHARRRGGLLPVSRDVGRQEREMGTDLFSCNHVERTPIAREGREIDLSPLLSTVEIIPAERAPKTKKDTIANLSALWSWLEQSGHIESNPWRNMTRLIRESTRGGKPEPAPYTPDEFKKLITKLPEGDPMLPMACISAYSGMRLQEIASVKLEHLAKDAIRVMEEKNPNSVRHVPLHPIIGPMVARIRETACDEYLISGLLPGGADGKRSHYVSKRFGYWLRSNGFTDETLTFHSFRRSFAQRCEHAKVPESTRSS
jgi:integrase